MTGSGLEASRTTVSPVADVVPVVSTMVKVSACTTTENGAGPSGSTVRKVVTVASFAFASVTTIATEA